MLNATQVLYNSNTSWILNLTAMVDDENLHDLRFEVEPMLNSEMEIGASGIFNWTVETALRHSNAKTLRFIVYDKYNMSDDHSVSFRYCGCEDPSECTFQTEDTATAECKCPNRFVTGTFCEIKKKPCDEYSCHTQDNCNNSYNGDGSPCAKCPSGFYEEIFGTAQHCLDFDECKNRTSNDCDHVCTNYEGFHNCSCNPGYNLDADNKTCLDINECVTDKSRCAEYYKETCLNLPGNYTCVCEAGYSKNAPNSACSPIVGKMYFGYLEYVLITESTRSNDTLLGGIQDASNTFLGYLNQTAGLLAIEIYKIFLTRSNIHFDFVLHMNATIDRDVVEGLIKAALNGKIIKFLDVQIQPIVNVHVHSPSEGGLCDVKPKRTDCVEQSTYCVNKNISDDYYDCACRFGYTEPITAKKREIYCDDVDECLLYTSDGTINERCVHGQFCTNTIGSWNCTCSPERLWMSVGTPEYPVYRCQGNHSYLGNISFIWEAQHINQSVIKYFLTSQITNVFTNESFDPEKKLMIPVSSLYVSVTILENTSYSEIEGMHLYRLTYEFRIRMGDPVSTDRLQRIGSERFKNDVKIGAATFNNITMFNESDNEICRRSNQGNCDRRTTTCKQENGTTTCVCKEGFQPRIYTEYSCEDVDESNSDDYTCSDGATKLNMEGNWTCMCPSYTELVYHNNTYQECSGAAYNACTSEAYKQFNCPNGNKTCNDSVWSCDCHDGYRLNGTGHSSKCEDDNECEGNRCGGGTCKNYDGGYSCNCKDGFVLNKNETSCIDINECESEKYQCVNADCTNFDGSYECHCKTGYYEPFHLDHAKFCIDINECTNGLYSCGNGTCQNVNGSFTCLCPRGYENYTENNMTYTCRDINECEHNQDYQCVNGSCKNTDGCWDCVCDVSSRAHSVNETYNECIVVFQYPVQFEVAVVLNPHNYVDTDDRIQASLIKLLSDIVNNSFNGCVLFPVEILPDSYHHSDQRNTEVTINVILSNRINETLLKNKFEDSFSKSGGVFIAPTGITCTVSLKKERQQVHLCQIDLYKNKCNPNSTKCKEYEATVKCECRGGFENLTYTGGVGTCEKIKDPKGDYPYLASVSINISSTVNVNNTDFQKTVQLQITTIYKQMFPNANIWVEILQLIQNSLGSGRKRRETAMASVEYVLHMDEHTDKKALIQAWTNCTTANSACYREVERLTNATENITNVFIFEATVTITADPWSPCNISNMCNPTSTACNDTSEKALCDCKPGYINNTFINDTGILNPYYECFTAEEPINPPTLTTSPTPTTSSPGSSTTTNTHTSTNTSSLPKASSGHDLTTKLNQQTAEGDKPTSAAEGTTSTTTKRKEGVKRDDKSSSASNTALIATGAGLGSVVLILVITVIVVCRLRNKKAQDAERIKLKELEKDRRNGFDNSLLGRNYLNSNSKHKSTNDLRESNRDNRQNSYYGGPFKPMEPNYTRPFKSVDPEPIWDRNGHAPGMNGRSGSLPDINGHVDMRLAPDTRKMSHRRDSDPLYSSPKKNPSPTQKPMENYRQNMVRVFPESGERLPRTRNNNFPKNTGHGRRSPEPDYYDPPESPKPDYQKRSRDRLNTSPDSGLNGYSSSGSPDVQRSRESYGSLGRGRFRMADTPF